MLTKIEQEEIKQIEAIYYMKPILKKIEDKVNKVGTVQALNYIHELLTTSKDEVEVMLDQRVKDKIIVDKSQARKSIAGAAFSNIFRYLFLKCKDNNLVRENIFITNKTADPLFKDMVTILVDEETQKPDMDIVIYSTDVQGVLKKCMIISLKTSLRERAAQTYKWKLLLEIATGNNDIKTKYNIRYSAQRIPLVCFATVNFYNEINNPQQRGMLKFFDNSFIGKPLGANFISNLSAIIDYANSNL